MMLQLRQTSVAGGHAVPGSLERRARQSMGARADTIYPKVASLLEAYHAAGELFLDVGC